MKMSESSNQIEHNTDGASAPTSQNAGATRPAGSPRAVPPHSPRKSSGVAVRQVAMVGMIALGAVWGAWVSKGVYDARHASNHIVKVQLAQIVQEYVQSTARSNMPPDQIGQQTAVFLKAVNDAVETHRSAGEVVLLANAVVAGNVPDITSEVRNEVYAKVARPQARAGNIDVQGEMQRYISASANSGQANGQ